MKDLVSVIVPVYNVEMYIDRCVESIISQTYKNIEVLLLDDASADSSGEKCEEWAKKDNRVKIYHLPHGGVARARNFGLKEAKGSFVLFVDSDDYIVPDLIASTYESLISNDADMVIFSLKNFYVSDKNVEVLRGEEKTLLSKEDAMYMMYGKQPDYVYMACNKLYKKSLFDGVVYPEGRVYEDNAVAHRILDKCKRVVYDKNQYYLRQLREDSIMGESKKFSKKNLDVLYGQKDRCEWYKDLQDKKFLSLVYAEYFHTIIHFYYETYYGLKDKNICCRLYCDFKNMYCIAKRSVKFSTKKSIGYCFFNYMPKVVIRVMHIWKTGKK